VAWALLAGAIAIELCATVGVKHSDGFTRPAIVAGVLLGYGISFFLMSRAVRAGLEISIGYAVWSGVGTAALVVVGAAWLDEPLTLIKVVGIGLVVLGVVVLTLADQT
jgi:small multidrug resistance pump